MALAYGVGGAATPPLHYMFLLPHRARESRFSQRARHAARAQGGGHPTRDADPAIGQRPRLKIVVAAGIASDERPRVSRGALMAHMERV